MTICRVSNDILDHLDSLEKSQAEWELDRPSREERIIDRRDELIGTAHFESDYEIMLDANVVAALKELLDTPYKNPNELTVRECDRVAHEAMQLIKAVQQKCEEIARWEEENK